MYKLIRFYNQNKTKVLITILIIVFIIATIQLLNYFAKTEQNVENKVIAEENIIKENKELTSYKSLVSGEKISNSKLKKDTDIINEFLNYCNNKDVNSAYNLLSKECKELMFSNINDFINIYYSKIFNGEKKLYTLENWIGDTYSVSINNDILSTGKIDNGNTNKDYITVVKEDEDYKLNINSYIGRTTSNKITENQNLNVTVQSIDTYMDYEIYNLIIENNLNNKILLDTSDDVKSVYLLDSNDMKYYFYGNEIAKNKLIINGKFKSSLKIKFNNSYSLSRNIKSIVFSKVILNYDEYIKLDNKLQYTDFYELQVKV